MVSLQRVIVMAAAGLLAASLSGCAARQSQSVYNQSEVGQAKVVSFGTVISSRPVEITGEVGRTGALLGGGTGASIGALASQGSAWGTIGGALAGAVAGAVVERSMDDHAGVEYVVTLENATTLSIVQNVAEGEAILPKGARVMVQSSGCDAASSLRAVLQKSNCYQRVFPADGLETEISRPKGIKLVDPGKK